MSLALLVYILLPTCLAFLYLQPYLEAQSESITYAIQSVFTNIRSSKSTSALNESIAQIITIVASIVAVCKDSLPSSDPHTTERGKEILAELSEQADRLSEVQNVQETSKEGRQAMAKSSYAIANALKELMRL